jgi:hypothetical protein
VFAAQHLALAERKRRLIERIEAQRKQIARGSEVLQKPAALADKVVEAVRYVKAKPWIAGVGVAVALALRRRHLWRWVGRGWTVWRGWRFTRRWMSDQGFIK